MDGLTQQELSCLFIKTFMEEMLAGLPRIIDMVKLSMPDPPLGDA